MSSITNKLPSKIKVFVVDDHPIVRRGFNMLINLEPDMMVCGEADSATVALEKILALRPDLAIVDLSLGAGCGLDLLKQLHSQRPRLKLLVYTMWDEVVYAERALRAGAQGYMTKEEGTEKAIIAIHLLMQGKTYISERIAAKMMEAMAGGRSSQHASYDSLSDRELEVLKQIGGGLGSREIAERLRVSIKTIESHREHIKAKLGLTGAPALVSYAYKYFHGDGSSPEIPLPPKRPPR